MRDRSELPGFSVIPEPDLLFARNKRDKHPLRGLLAHGPYGLKYGAPSTLRLALLAPQANLNQLRKLVQELGSFAQTREVPAYYPDYPGFEKVFRVPIAPIEAKLVFAFPDELDAPCRTRQQASIGERPLSMYLAIDNGALKFRCCAHLPAARLGKLFRGGGF
jgi:hypothetical protein